MIELNKKGSFWRIGGLMLGFILVIAISLVILLLMYSWNYGFNQITTSLINIPTTSNITNISYASQLTFGQLNQGVSEFRWISYLIMFGMIIGIIISCFLVRMHPLYALVYFALFCILLYLSIFVSRSYENLYNSGTDFTAGLQNWQGASFFLLNLPMIIGITGVLGSIPLFVNLIKDREDAYG